MKILVNRKKSLFDGDQEKLFSSEFHLKCSNCSGLIPFYPAKLVNCSQLSSSDIDEIIANIKGVKVVRLGTDVFIKVNDVPLKYASLNCPSCGKKYLGLFGVGEYQPTRFMLFQVAIATP